MNITQALPRRMRFEAKAASSVELCVAEWISGSNYRETTIVTAERSDAPPLLDVHVLRLKPARRFSSFDLAFQIRQRLRKRLDLIVSQQHIATAARISAVNAYVPVILQTHNFVEPPVNGTGAAVQNWLRRREFGRLAGITLISDATRAQFERDWPEVTIPRAVITNGFDFRDWTAKRPRERNVLVVGRNQPEKGLLEAAQGAAVFLANHPGWTATFVISEIAANPTYFELVRAVLAVAPQARILNDVPYAEVKSLTERAAVVIVASKWLEPFGRTALEAHAAGAALISSGSGGLTQISGDTALMLPEVTGPAVAAALERVGNDEAFAREIAMRGANRVRRLFPLTRDAADGVVGAEPVCERLDRFYREVVTRRALL